MNPISRNTLATVTGNIAGPLFGIPSLTVLVLAAINEIRASLTPGDVTANPDALLTTLQTLNALNSNFIVLATLGFLLACGCWLLAKALPHHPAPARQANPTVGPAGLTVSLRG